MITVRIPKEIKDYKEKLIAGLTVRQLISILGIAVVCIPTYIFGKKYLGDEIASWIIIPIMLPMVAIGFISKNGMPFEKYAIAIFRNQVLYPQKTSFRTDNFFRYYQDLEIKEENEGINKKQLKKYKEEATLERAFLLEEMEKRGEYISLKNIDEQLITVSKPKKTSKKCKEKKEKIVKKSKAQIIYESVIEKQKEDPHYIPNKKEGRLLLQYSKECEKKRISEIQKAKQDIKKKNTEMNKRKKTKTFIPKSTQDDLPYIADFEEGLFEVEPNKFSKCYIINDINYLTASEDEQIKIFCKWGEFLNFFPEDTNIAIIIDNRIVSISEQEKKIFFKMRGDSYDIHRKEYNNILKRQMMAGNNDILQQKYITVTIDSDSPYEALLRFHKLDQEVINNLNSIGVKATVMSTDERLALIHDKMRRGREGEFNINYDFLKERGLSSKDYVAPSSFLFRNKDYFMIENSYYRCMFINNLPASLSDSFLNTITSCNFSVVTNLSIQPVAQDKALRMIKRQLTGMESNKIEAEKKANRAGYSAATISHDLKNSLAQGEELLDDMTNKNQKMFFVSMMLMVCGDTFEELEENTKALMGKVRKFTCQLQVFDNQQRDAFKVCMPMGITPNKKLYVERTLTTESTAIFMPFSSVELFQIGGSFIGLNQISQNLIFCDRTKMKTPSGFVLGSSGSGKSFACKKQMLNVLLGDDQTGLLVIDPEGEYTDMAKVFNGSLVELSTGADTYINPLDMDINYGLDNTDDPEKITLQKKKEKALKRKVEYLMSIIQFMMMDSNNNVSLSPQQKTIIDRAITKTYQNYFDHDFDDEYLPTLIDLQDMLDEERGTEAADSIAEAVAYYTRGSMDLFSHKSNIDLSNRFVVFNIRNLGTELKQIGLLIVLDFIWNRMLSNCQKKLRTHIYIDEIHVLFKNSFSESYIQNIYKRGRKFGAVISGVTQDITDLVKSNVARTMLTNSDFVMMLNQKPDNIRQLMEVLNITENQSTYIDAVDPGTGLLYAEKMIIPFSDHFPKSSYLYTLMSTNFNEDSNQEVEEYIYELVKKNERGQIQDYKQEELENVV